MPIKLLSQNLVNQIAAGEVIERPSSVLKELMENAIDAGASKVTVKIMDAGKSFISVSDNGSGMDADSLRLCIMSHATSKLTDENLFNIHTMGFRGEALPSIASISRMTIMSSEDDSEGHKIQLDGAVEVDFSPLNKSKGTTVEVRDLFFATPARLKFLKSDSVEMDHCYTIFNRIALANKNISFELSDEKKTKLSYRATDNLQERVIDVCGDQVGKNIFSIDKKYDSMHLYGFLGVPTFNKSSNSYQYFFVNNRFVKDRSFFIALKSAYSTLVPAGRFPVAILYLDVAPEAVDVNVHPTKTEVRFRNEDKVRSFIISAVRDVLLSYGSSKVSTQLVDNFVEKITKPVVTKQYTPLPFSTFSNKSDNFEKLENILIDSRKLSNKSSEANFYNINKSTKTENEHENNALFKNTKTNEQKSINPDFFLGDAVCQIHDTYIIAKNDNGLIIIDQHAAAERITLEKLRQNLVIDSQNLLLPEVCNLNSSQVEAFEINKNFLNSFGVFYEKMTDDLISVTALPAMLETSNAKALINDIADELIEFGDTYSLEEKVHKILSTMSCHGSLRANHALTKEAMNSLLRQMEQTPNIGQCCHGRPSYVKLTLSDLNKFFERT